MPGKLVEVAAVLVREDGTGYLRLRGLGGIRDRLLFTTAPPDVVLLAGKELNIKGQRFLYLGEVVAKRDGESELTFVLGADGNLRADVR